MGQTITYKVILYFTNSSDPVEQDVPLCDAATSFVRPTRRHDEIIGRTVHLELLRRVAHGNDLFADPKDTAQLRVQHRGGRTDTAELLRQVALLDCLQHHLSVVHHRIGKEAETEEQLQLNTI